MSKINKYMFAVFCMLLSFNLCFGQLNIQENQVIKSGTSHRGNYLLFSSAEILGGDSLTYVSTAHFIVERATYNGNSNAEPAYVKMANVKPVATQKELRAMFNQKELDALLYRYKLQNTNELLRLFNTRSAFKTIEDDYSLDIRFQIAMGDAWLDEKAEKGRTYIYRITRVDNNNTSTVMGYAVQTVKDENEGLKHFRVDSSRVRTYNDTVLSLKWNYTIDQAHPEENADRILALGTRNENFTVVNKSMPSLRFRMYILKNGILLPGISKRGAYLNSNQVEGIVQLSAKPEDEILAWVVPEDIFGNQGQPSDTIFAYAISYKNAPLLLKLNSEEVLDGVRLSWPQAPSKPYIKGIQIQRKAGEDSYEEIAMLPVTDTAFIDYKLKVGQKYTYDARYIFAQSVGFTQEVPAQTIGSYTKFSKPMPPENLHAVQEGANIRLDWDSAKNNSLYAYHVYRGYDGTEPTLLSGAITEGTYFIDTSAELSGRSVYTYYVIAENLRQDVSLPSQPVQIKPDRAVKVYPPSAVQTYYANGKLNLYWDDARKMDNYITGYQVQRSAAGTGNFQNLGGVTNFPQCTDSNLSYGAAYEYRVASVGAAGEVSAYSAATLFELPKEKDFTKVNITVRNTHEGVALSWAGVERPGQQSYMIYRRKAGEESFAMLANVPLGTAAYTDKTVTAGDNYVYAIALKFQDEEGPKSDVKSITFKPAAQPEILK